MFLAAFLIGLREGLEAALIIGILLAFVRRSGRGEAARSVWLGVTAAIGIAVVLGAALTFGRYRLSFQGQEILGGSLSLLAVAMVTWMVFWMAKAGRGIKAELEGKTHAALAIGARAVFWIALVSVGREGLETTVMLWGWAGQPAALVGALLGVTLAAGIGYALNRGLVRINFGTFFTWSGAILIVVAAGILAYGIHDLQEAALLPGPYSGHPITPTDLRTGEVLVGLTDGPFWLAAFPFGWAFDLTSVIDPTGWLATVLRGTIGFTPQMSWLEVVAWFSYLISVLPKFLRRARPASAPAPARVPNAESVVPQPELARS